jgi:anaerobic selenocysteine-containing dehydrogenase
MSAAPAPRPAARPAEFVHRTCPLCEAKCGIAVEVDRSLQRVVTIRGDRLDPLSAGYLCPKAYALKGLHEDPDRLRRPLRRDGSTWREIGWDEALDLVSSRLKEIRSAYGADAIATYLGNPNAHDGFAGLYTPGFQRALGTRWRFSATSVDQLPKSLSSCLMFGSPTHFPVPDVDRTRLLVVLGANPLASNGSIMTAPDMPGRLAALRERGGKLVVVDPRRSETARIADRHLAIRPGTDAFFLFSLVHVLFDEGLVALGRLADFTNGTEAVRALAREFPPERTAAVTGIAPDQTRALARELATTPHAAVYGRIGTCTQEFGTLASWLVDVVNVLTGNADRPGGVMWPRSPAGAAKDRPARRAAVPYARWRSRVRGLPEFAGELPVAALAEEIDSAGDARVRALVTVAGNPVLSTPNGARLAKALSSLDFMVSVDIYLNETTRFADVILPPTGHLERGNFDFFFHALMVRQSVKWTPPVFEKPPGSRHQWEILRDLTARLSGATQEAVDEAMLQHFLGSAVGEGSACPDVTPEEARKKLGDVAGPERLIDLRLRAGPFGDRFRDDAPGLSLAKLRAAEHGIDLGALEPRLPDMLATPSGRIELAPPLLVEDVARLRAALDERGGGRGLVLVGRRHLRSNNSWMHNVAALAKGPERCTLLVHPGDAARLGLEDGGRARVRSRVGEVTVPVSVTEEMMPGVVSLPHGFGHDAEGVRLSVARRHAGVNSNLLADETLLDTVSGNAVLNGIPVEVSAA